MLEDQRYYSLMRCFIGARGDAEAAAMKAYRAGLLPSHLRMADVSGTGSADVSTLGRGVRDVFFASLGEGPGIFDAVSRRSVHAQLRVRTFIPTAPLTAQVTPEGTAVALSRFSLTPASLTPRKCAALVAATLESLETPEGQDAISAELRDAVTLAVDADFLALLESGAGYSGSLSGDPLADIQVLAGEVNLTGVGDFVLAVSPAVAHQMIGAPASFPDMGPTGGRACGVETYVSAGCPGMTLIDPAAVLTGAESFQLRYSTQASLEFDDSPAMDSTTPAGPTGKVVSCFQAEAAALLAERHYGALVVRASGVAVLAEETT